jgi:hypothetical protein
MTTSIVRLATEVNPYNTDDDSLVFAYCEGGTYKTRAKLVQAAKAFYQTYRSNHRLVSIPSCLSPDFDDPLYEQEFGRWISSCAGRRHIGRLRLTSIIYCENI